jgi:hypothetical protein
MKHKLSDDDLWRLRLRSQRLIPAWTRPGLAPQAILEEVVGVQAQDLSAALLAIRARSVGLTSADIQQARRAEPAILQTWCMRGTLHLVSCQDARWLIPFFGPTCIASGRRRFTQLGWDEAHAARGLRLLQDALGAPEGLTRAELVQLLAQNNLPSTGQAPVHLIFRAAFEGLLAIGPDRGRHTTYRSFEKWVGPLQPLPYELALAQLARRYLNAYGPAGPADLAAWSGLKIAEARQAWRLLADEITQLDTSRGPTWLLTSRLGWLDELAAVPSLVRLLPWFDNLLLGYASREWLCPPAFAKRINPGGGLIHPTLLVNGAILATWQLLHRRAELEVHLAPFQPLDPLLHPALETEVSDIGRFLGTPASLV